VALKMARLAVEVHWLVLLEPMVLERQELEA
jgi:hypothetical protein